MKLINKLSFWYNKNSVLLNNIFLALFIILIAFLAYVPIHIYRLSFNHLELSTNNHDWANFGSYYAGIVGTFLAFINILVLIRLTLAASKFNKKSLEKQLAHSTCKEYQNKINDLTFEFFENLEMFREMKEKKYLERAKERLFRIKFFIDSFITETQAFMTSDKDSLLTSTEELKSAIDSLIASSFTNKETIELFFDKKSNFIRIVFNLILK